jgi:hypothetical protein
MFKRAFAAAGLECFGPHSVRSTLTALGEQVCRTPEEFKAWSQNLGHEDVLTTFRSYGAVSGGGRRSSCVCYVVLARKIQCSDPVHGECPLFDAV